MLDTAITQGCLGCMSSFGLVSDHHREPKCIHFTHFIGEETEAPENHPGAFSKPLNQRELRLEMEARVCLLLTAVLSILGSF